MARRLLAVAVAVSLTLAAILLTSHSAPTEAADSLSYGSSLAGNETLVSNGGVFELGFFTPKGGNGRYLGIWYRDIPGPTIVWVANRHNPVVGSPGELRLSAGGQLQVVDGTTVAWSAGSVTGGGGARLLDSGNFVITDDDGSVSWRSFDHPTDTLLPGMRLGRDPRSGIDTSLTAWRSLTDASPGNLRFQHIQGSILTQFELIKGRKRIYATGGAEFFMSKEFHFNIASGYFSYSATIHSLLSRLVVDSSLGQLRMLIWINKKWVAFSYYPSDRCDDFAWCGAHAYCNTSKMCSCLPGYNPRSLSSWKLRDYSQGCVLQKACTDTDGFHCFMGMKLPVAEMAKAYRGVSVNQCRNICLSNCSCRAYAASSIGCIIWTGELLDMRQFNSDMEEQEVYIRVARSDASPIADPGKSTEGRAPQATDQPESHKKKTVITIAGSVLAGISAIFIICVLLHYYGLVPWKRGSDIESFMKRGSDIESFMKEQGSSQPRWPVKYTFAQLKQITMSFSVKLGEGGYGAVYRGQFPGGSNVPVAVKLLKNKKGTEEDFENEVTTISRASHCNIISLLGYCLEGSHRALVYEYMQNGSLNLYKFGIFDSIERKQLQWQKLYYIIVGIARGIDYLCTGCRTQIVHFDIKPANILLDHNLRPKISDFGLAKLCKKKEREVEISGPRGTPGYMAPEVYSTQYGRPSSKSDIYSFGMVILKMVGAREMENLAATGSQTFPGYLFDHVDEFCSNVTGERNSEATKLVKKMVIVALYCVQVHPAQRPPTSKILEMLESESFKLELPQQIGEPAQQYNDEAPQLIPIQNNENQPHEEIIQVVNPNAEDSPLIDEQVIAMDDATESDSDLYPQAQLPIPQVDIVPFPNFNNLQPLIPEEFPEEELMGWIGQNGNHTAGYGNAFFQNENHLASTENISALQPVDPNVIPAVEGVQLSVPAEQQPIGQNVNPAGDEIHLPVFGLAPDSQIGFIRTIMTDPDPTVLKVNSYLGPLFSRDPAITGKRPMPVDNTYRFELDAFSWASSENGDTSKSLSPVALRMWAKFFSNKDPGQPTVSIPSEWMNFFTLTLLKDSTNEWASEFLKFQAWAHLNKASDDPFTRIIVRGKAMAPRVEDLFNLMCIILQDVQFTEQQRFKQFVPQSKARMENRLRGSGHGIAATRMDAKLNAAGWISEQMGSVSYLEYLRDLETKIDQDWDSISSSLEEMRKSLFSKNGWLINLTSDWKNLEKSSQHIAKFLDSLPTHPSLGSDPWLSRLPSVNEAIVVPTQVNYVGKAGNLYQSGYQLNGSAYVISKHISNTWLWDRVRVSGGAYGGFCDFDTHSVFSYLSYRYPNLLKTLEVYDETARFLRELQTDDDALTKAIIGTIGDVDAYQLPDAKGYSSLMRYLLGITDEERQQRREEILSTSLKDFKELADAVETIEDNGVVVAVASPDDVEAANKENPVFPEVKKCL